LPSYRHLIPNKQALQIFIFSISKLNSGRR
jgi:hypothetical protein